MPRLDTNIDTKTSTLEKVSIGFMVGTGLIVVSSFLVAAGWIGIAKLTNNTNNSDNVIQQASNTNISNNLNVIDNTNTVPVNVQGDTIDRQFNTEQ
ncbi:MAG: hypothetical protein V1838_01045 [Patescibacteria group bacterium]